MKRTAKQFSALLSLFLAFSIALSSCAKEKAPENEKDGETDVSPITVEKVTIEQETVKSTVEQADPALDDEFNVIIIGNSFSTGWPDELNGLMTAAGIEVNIFTVYYSGCPLSSHWYWLKTGQKHYRLRHHIQGGGSHDDNDVNLQFCLKQRNWDVISLQQHFGPKNALSYDEMLKSCTPFAENIYNYLKENFPKTKLLWHETWAYEVGWSRDGVTVPDVAFQTTYYENIKAVSQKIATDNGVPMVPCGDAWQIARHEYNSGDLSRDLYHDGPENGGQYLNACVWFETLTGQSCIGNTWRPKYEIAEERILMLQDAAHKAVEHNTIK